MGWKHNSECQAAKNALKATMMKSMADSFLAYRIKRWQEPEKCWLYFLRAFSARILLCSFRIAVMSS
jgi:hypothetical protein